MKEVTRGQALQLQSLFATTTRWDALDGDFIQHEIIQLPAAELGRRFTAFLKNRGQLIVGEPRVVQIDRSQPFDPVPLLGPGWTVEEEDQQALAVSSLNLDQVESINCLKVGETSISAQENLFRLKSSGQICLDAKIFELWWYNQDLIPRRFYKMTCHGIPYFFFDGTILRDQYGFLFTLCMFWDGIKWTYINQHMGYNRAGRHPSVVLSR